MGLLGPPNIEKLKAKKDLRGLIKALDYQKDLRVQRDAAQALGEIGDPRAIEPLIVCLTQENKGVREAAATALFHLNSPAVEPLIAALRHGTGYQAFYGALILGMIGDPRAVDALVTACNSEHESMALIAVEALTRIKPPDVKALVTVLGNQHEVTRQAASSALVNIGAPAVTPLIAALRDKEAKVRRVITDTLVQIGEPSVKPLINALNSKDKVVRRAAAEALGKINDANAVDPLIIMLSDKVTDVRQAAALALGEIGEVRAVEPLIAALRDKDPRVFKTAAEALSKIGDSRAVEPLIAALGDKDEHVRRWAAEALDKMGWQPDQGADGAAYWIAKGDFDRCVQIGAPAVGPLIDALSDDARDLRMSAAQALGQIGDAHAVEPLIAALRDDTWDVRPSAAVALGKIGDPRAVKPLFTALGEENGVVRRYAAQALGQIGDPHAVEPLIAALGVKYIYVRNSALNSLDKLGWKPDRGAKGAAYWIVKGDLNQCIQIGSPAVESLITALNFLYDDDLRDRPEKVAVVEALGQIGDPRATKPLIDALYTKEAGLYRTWDIRKAAAKALIDMYNSGQLTENDNALILKHRSAIVKRHHDGWAPSDCIHDDTGIGVKFPV